MESISGWGSAEGALGGAPLFWVWVYLDLSLPS